MYVLKYFRNFFGQFLLKIFLMAHEIYSYSFLKSIHHCLIRLTPLAGQICRDLAIEIRVNHQHHPSRRLIPSGGRISTLELRVKQQPTKPFYSPFFSLGDTAALSVGESKPRVFATIGITTEVPMHHSSILQSINK